MNLSSADITPVFRPKYLFIRILEACNAGCFMCEFSNSKVSYRFSVADFEQIIPQAKELGVRYIRFTGGEPLLHKDLTTLISVARDHNFETSVITNGALIDKQLDRLVGAGLKHLIVSIDGATAETHDRFRKVPGLFERAISGIKKARAMELVVRVNTVVGPHNFREMVSLQQVLIKLGVQQWELSTLKNGEKLNYDDANEVLNLSRSIYEGDSKLKPLGFPWYGETEQEQADYFYQGLPPRSRLPSCQVAQDIIYLDGKNSELYCCSCLSHDLPYAELKASARDQDGQINLKNPSFEKQKSWFTANGPKVCGGCSTTAAGYSYFVQTEEKVPDWIY